MELETVIENAIQDYTQAGGGTSDPVVEAATPAVEASAPDPVIEDTPLEAPASSPVEATPPEGVVPTQAQEVPPAQSSSKEDAFSKEFGIPARMFDGKENRIPYSRVVAITESKVNKALAPIQKELTDFRAKVTDYEGRLQRVGEFEQVLTKDPQKFLQILQTIPAYKPLFDTLAQYDTLQKQQVAGVATSTPQTQAPIPDDMPAPDMPLADGTSVYSMDGLKSLLAWQAKSIEGRVTKQYEERYKPIESEWQARDRVQKLIPQVQAEINEARSWPEFNEHEAAIVEVLKQYPQASLEAAYRHVVVPKIQARVQDMTPQRDRMRAEILAELKKAPVSTSGPAVSGKASPIPAGPRSLESIIAEANGIKL